MFKIYTSFQEINMEELLSVYRQSFKKDALERYKMLSLFEALECVNREFEDYLRYDFFKISGAFYAIWTEQGNYISALRIEPYEDGVLLQGLETRQEYRGKGFAKKLLMAVLQIEGILFPVYSHIAKDNIASIRVHKVCGFEKYLDYARYIDGTATRNAYTFRLKMKPC